MSLPRACIATLGAYAYGCLAQPACVIFASQQPLWGGVGEGDVTGNNKSVQSAAVRQLQALALLCDHSQGPIVWKSDARTHDYCLNCVR
jgi:hypothetical protein